MDELKDFVDSDSVSINTLALEETAQEERSIEITRLHSLSKKVCFLHTDVLYYRNGKSSMGTACYNAWNILIKKVGGSPNTWKDLGYILGISQDDMNYIEFTIKENFVDMVLKVYRQNNDATIDKIVDAFVTLNRYDILKAIEEPFCEIAQYFNIDDSGYQSQSRSQGNKEIVRLKNLPNDLPPALNKYMLITDNDPRKPKYPMLRPSVSNQEPLAKDCRTLLLTYTEDGLPTAINIQEYVDNWTDIPNVKVITLNNSRGELYQNPEKFIRECFEKADLIVPIITSGYLNEIKSHNPVISNTSDNMDHKYVNFIYNLIANHYIHVTGCLNKKVRSVMPQNANLDLFSRLAMYPDLLPWTYETNFDTQFKAFLKTNNSS